MNKTTQINEKDSKVFRALCDYAAEAGVNLKYLQAHLICWLLEKECADEFGVFLFGTQFIASHFGPMLPSVSLDSVYRAKVTESDKAYLKKYFIRAEKYFYLTYEQLQKRAYDFPDSQWTNAYRNGDGVNSCIVHFAVAS